HSPYDQTPKTLAMQEANRNIQLGDNSTHTWLPLNLAVSFRTRNVGNPDEDDPANPPIMGAQLHEEQPNYHSVTLNRDQPRSTCRLCGECDIGCNYGSKNTLDYTYITAAIHQKPNPARVETLCEVKTVAPLDETGYRVEFIRHDPDAIDPATGRCPPPPRFTITCKRLIIAAGTFGSPYLLMRNLAAFPRVNANTLGSRFSVNGDLLSFIINSKERRNGKLAPRRLDPSLGPVITSAIRVGDSLDGNGAQGRGFYIEDAGISYLLGWIAELSGLPGTLIRGLKFLKMRLKYRTGLNNDANLSAEFANLLGPANTTLSTLALIAMGRDFANGRLYLK